MNFNEYQKLAHLTAVYPSNSAKYYLTLGLTGEAGEVANKIKKEIRDNEPVNKDEIKGELGDVLWYLSELALTYGIGLDDVARSNIEKLQDRKRRGALRGSGDHR
ncbi:MAG: nucleoside triphosphate pyrophosphohydrolase family protein [Nitrososphaerota archaeon]|jgi:NTP pyrophosphatase (non-canonical NTP hydrolase)|nr:nucleoside triphosphate pyrophosphohydrolase family protein [Nitrososphaerota archaeon]MDG6927585.1 nucleoside triphosphate pyrophosphohydrolase family protein [Nitrososphaerota archaeon]MDG6930641.1 nucleoside triphosphate pyrophosphohydrolase family protein [Nitrososphaerota archaeon]MDG6932476.1 nucleoside triphosphate pyrophosphohydrolase family protein [Nitrososphaerota archaeon]MDG6936243.1 nucleoside triphosphate pyrophosphohydrolase family protein [Nitrososphaerota archaeon]